jgi:hypothetical protein
MPLPIHLIKQSKIHTSFWNPDLGFRIADCCEQESGIIRTVSLEPVFNPTSSFSLYLGTYTYARKHLFGGSLGLVFVQFIAQGSNTDARQFGSLGMLAVLMDESHQ